MLGAVNVIQPIEGQPRTAHPNELARLQDPPYRKALIVPLPVTTSAVSEALASPCMRACATGSLAVSFISSIF